MNGSEKFDLESKSIDVSGNGLPVMEIFPSVQGEGFHTGKAAVFIRLAGCDLACHWCDSKESWNSGFWPTKPLGKIIADAKRFEIPAVIITGGEPLSNNLEPLTATLKSLGIETFLETSGCYPITGEWDWVCVSPKEQQPPLLDALKRADELKVVIEKKSDFKWAEQNGAKVSEKCLLYLQPEWSVSVNIIPAITEYILKNPRWMLSLQSHKYIGIP